MSVGAAQADGEVALQPHLHRTAVLREVLDQPLGERHERLPGHERARLAGGVVLERLLDRRAVVPAGDDLDVDAVAIVRLGDEHELGGERLGDAAHEAAQERVADLAGCALRDGPQQLRPAEAGSLERRHRGGLFQGIPSRYSAVHQLRLPGGSSISDCISA